MCAAVPLLCPYCGRILGSSWIPPLKTSMTAFRKCGHEEGVTALLSISASGIGKVLVAVCLSEISMSIAVADRGNAPFARKPHYLANSGRVTER